MLGKLLDKKYKVTALIGEGGMGSVYKGEHVHLKRDCAIKVVRREIASDPVTLKRFKLEAEAASILKHPNIIETYDFGITDDDLAYIVMEFLVGVSLDDVMERHKFLYYEQAIPIFLQVCDALVHAHSKGVLHRDLKPPNIMLTESENGDMHVKLVDFGIAKLMPGAGHRIEKLTQTGEVFGSPMYMSPEQCMGQDIDGRADLYSLACVMYETLTGKPPFSGENFVQIVSKHLKQPPPAFAEIAPSNPIPAGLEKIVMQCLSKEPESRFSSVAELRKNLAQMFADERLNDSPAKMQSSEPYSPANKLTSLERPRPISNGLLFEETQSSAFNADATAAATSYPEAWSGYWGGTLSITAAEDLETGRITRIKSRVGDRGITVFHFVREEMNVNLKPPIIFLKPQESALKECWYKVVEINRLKEQAKAKKHDLDLNQIVSKTPIMQLGNVELHTLAGSSQKITVFVNAVRELSPGAYEQRIEKIAEHHDTSSGLDTMTIFEVIAQLRQNGPASLFSHIELTRYRMDRTIRSRLVYEGTLTRDWQTYAEEISTQMSCSWQTIVNDFDI